MNATSIPVPQSSGPSLNVVRGDAEDPSPVFVSGATGFIGSALIGALRADHLQVVAGTRRPTQQSSTASVTWRFVDVDQPRRNGLVESLRGTAVAYYLVHGMADGPDYADREHRAAERFRDAAQRAGVQRIIYLGGVAPKGRPSRHLASRLKTGDILRSGLVPCVELRAGMVVGAGSASFEMVSDVATLSPILAIPSWLRARSQPVFIDDVVAALRRAAEIPVDGSVIFGLPGPQTLSVEQILTLTARAAGRRLRVRRLPFVPKRLVARVAGLVSKVDRNISRELLNGLRHDLISNEPNFFAAHMGSRELAPFETAAGLAMS